MTPLSNGSKAVQIAAEHLVETEQRLTTAEARIAVLENEVATRDGRLAEATETINRVEHQRNLWMLHAVELARAQMDVAALHNDATRRAREILDVASLHDNLAAAAPQDTPQSRT